MFFSIKYKNVHIRCWTNIGKMDVVELSDFTNFVKMLYIQSPILFTTNFKTQFNNKLIEFKPSELYEVFTIEVN
jgi:hypothetical protein